MSDQEGMLAQARLMSPESIRLPDRMERAIQIASSGMVTGSEKHGFLIQSSSGHRHYRVNRGVCNCPDESPRCKHVLAVEMLLRYADHLAQRLGCDPPGRVEDIPALEAEWESLLRECAGYKPPQPGMLFGFGLEAVRDDMAQDDIDREKYTGVRYPAAIRTPIPWVAQILGLCPQYEFRRQFLRGKKDYRKADKRFRRGVWVYWQLPAGLYEAQEVEPAHPRPVGNRFFFRVENQSIRRISRKEVIACLRQGSGSSSHS